MTRAREIRDVADALRSVIDGMVATTAPLDVFDGVADDLRAIAAKLDGYPRTNLYEGYAESSLSGGSVDDDSVVGPFDNSPIMGRANPLAPPLTLAVDHEAGKVVGQVNFGPAYEGPPGHVHGGYVAAIFDELLGLTQSLGGTPGMTGRLTIHYRQPTPLRTDLRMEGVVERVSGRKRICTGTLWNGDTLLAESEGLFVSVDFAKIAALLEQR